MESTFKLRLPIRNSYRKAEKVTATNSQFSDESLAALAARNAEKTQASIGQLGPRYLLHPANRVQRLQQPRDRSSILSAGALVRH